MIDNHKININNSIEHNFIETDTYMESIKTPIKVEVNSVYENDSVRKNRAKFQTVSEASGINTDENINTDDSTSSEKQKEVIIYPNTSDQCHEFSVSTLDRKLKEIHKLNIKTPKKIKHIDIADTNNDIQLSFQIQAPNTNQLNAINIAMNPSKLINEHLSEIQLRIIGHKRSATMYLTREKVIGYPVTILSAFLTSTIMMSIANDDISNEMILKYVNIALSVLSFLFSVSRTYLNYAEKFQSHDLSSKLYTTLLRSVEVRLIKNHLDKEEKRDIFKDIVDQMSIIEQYETPIPNKIDNVVRSGHRLISDSI
jgi:hypothetical protein